IMVNCNPETVSTDYDTSDRLYFEPLTIETVLDIVRVESARGELAGLNIQFGGQTPLKLAAELEAAGVPILGTSPDAIDLAEDRDRFRNLLRELGLKQPANATCVSAEEGARLAGEIGYPVVVRPSYVLGGRAMKIIHDAGDLEHYLKEAVKVSGTSPVLIDRFIEDAIEVDVDALADGESVVVAGVMEHIEEAGIHSGDSACSLPPHSLSDELVARIRAETEALAHKIGVRGLMNVQFAVKDNEIYVLEVNPRASRTVPFVAKSTGRQIAKIAARIMAGEKLSAFDLKSNGGGHISVKEAVFPFARFPGVDLLLGPEMKSTGEVMGIDTDFGRAFAKAQLGAGAELPVQGSVFLSVRDRDKNTLTAIASELTGMGFRLIATRGTAKALAAAGVQVQPINKVHEGRPHIVDALKNGDIQLVVNTTEGAQAIADSYELRRSALEYKIPYFTTIAGSQAMLRAVAALKSGALAVETLQSYSQTFEGQGV
ncbi:MAG: carbamoyl-phosphate synthase large subunit, partial [Alphaproteobacteria bacterium]